MSNTISNSDDVIDSRNVIARIEELEAMFESDGILNSDDAAELHSLRALAEEAEGYAADWNHGEALIRDSYFKVYAQTLAEETGMIDGLEQWPTRCIDWGQAARELQMDYTSVEFDGVTYWIR